ncbi:MAG TPA: beta-ketoacyl reductase, partial [Kofleriaceae bacterium]|nr:beta-ketoacyl reductase [Kofleriaceae bacterium]
PVGPEIVRWLARRGAPRIAVLSRRGMDPAVLAALEAELAPLGARLTSLACDVADRPALAAALAQLRADGPPVRSVVHAANAAHLVAVADETLAHLARAMAAKATGARLLDELLDPAELEHFILFSSIAGVWGSGEHAAYAAANAYLDAFAAHRTAVRGRPTLSVAWGVWAAESRIDLVRLRGQGLVPLDAGDAFAALDELLARGETFEAVADVDWPTFGPVFASARPRPLIAELPVEPPVEPGRAAGGAEPGLEGPADSERGGLAAHLATLTPEEQLRTLRELVARELAATLRHDAPPAGGAERAFRELGIDSLTAVELRNRLARATGKALPVTLVFDHPTPHALAAYLQSRLVADGHTSVLAALDQLQARLEATVGQLARDHVDRACVRDRLAALTALLDASPSGAAAAGDDDLLTASDDELLELIDRELQG